MICADWANKLNEVKKIASGGVRNGFSGQKSGNSEAEKELWLPGISTSSEAPCAPQSVSFPAPQLRFSLLLCRDQDLR